MSVTPAIRVEGLGKQYVVGRRRAQNFREAFSRMFERGEGGAGREETFWALKDVSFEVQPGEVLGIIGRNGAGKSTLLKILSRITEPAEGKIEISGRVGSLLEVGTGFHPELSGRENVYLNGAILGMRRQEIRRKFDEIVAFAEVEKFIDTPVKRYSSGMYMRLAFAVAAHLEPEILVVDEVLAVGDAEFQRKCLGKMNHVASTGRTVLFVSHNMPAVEALCSRALLLKRGSVVADAKPRAAIDRYLAGEPESLEGSGDVGFWDLSHHANAYGSGTLHIVGVRTRTSEGRLTGVFRMGDGMEIEVVTRNLTSVRAAAVGVLFSAIDGLRVTSLSTRMCSRAPETYDADPNVFVFGVPSLPFVPGEYDLSISVIGGGAESRIDYVENGARIRIEPADVFGTGFAMSRDYGQVFLSADWRHGEGDGAPSANR